MTSRLPVNRTQDLRDGSLQIRLATSAEGIATEELPFRMGRLRIVLQTASNREPFFPWQWRDDGHAPHVAGERKPDRVLVGYSIEEMRIGVASAQPANQDPLPDEQFVGQSSLGTIIEGAGFRREPPLLIPLDSGANGDPKVVPARFFFVANESVNAGQSQRVDFRLERLPVPAGATGDSRTSVVVLDSHPSFLAKVDVRFLQPSSRDLGDHIVARRSPISAEQDGWEILDDDATEEGFELILPSQGIGEEIVKDRSVKDGEILDFRFAAPTVLRLAPERLERRYVAIPWNLRRIWGRAGDDAPGTIMLSADLELLYGLNASLENKRSVIAELGAKLGELPTPSAGVIQWPASEGQLKRYAEAWNDYATIYQLWLTRMAVLRTVPQPSRGTTFHVGGGSLIGARVKPNDDDPETPIGAQLKYPADGNVASLPNVHTESGLAGGFHYGFESHVIYKEVVESWESLFFRRDRGCRVLLRRRLGKTDGAIRSRQEHHPIHNQYGSDGCLRC